VIIYHITHEDFWKTAQASGVYLTDSLAKEGFIHCSTQPQILNTARRYYPGQKDLVLLCINPQKVLSEIRYENLLGGIDQFPHVYGNINLDAIIRVVQFPPSERGDFQFPESLLDLLDKSVLNQS
jgi:uncharacterized protein (DUF952 family)